ncbi:MAG: GNAT family N-acetyltransferase [Marmoricola sp.]
MIRLVVPSVDYHRSWLAAAEEFAQTGEYMHGSGLAPDDMADEDVMGTIFRPSKMTSTEVFAQFCHEMRERTKRDVVEPLGWVPDSKLFIVEGNEFVGSASIRHELNDWLLREGGHIGYSVRPSARRRGIATEALRQGLDLARGLGIDRALVTCKDDNLASAGTIEKNGGVLENVLDGNRRYWIDL